MAADPGDDEKYLDDEELVAKTEEFKQLMMYPYKTIQTFLFYKRKLEFILYINSIFI